MIGVPRYYSNGVNVAYGPYDLTLTFVEHDPTRLPDAVEDGQREPSTKPVVQVVTSLGHAKALIPALVKAIAAYEAQFGSIPAPGFDQQSKE